jgi:hypothetical protein
MSIEIRKISEIKPNPQNPRLIKDDKFKRLVKSIQDFPEMLDLRPIVVDENMVVLGGNMRLKACTEAGIKKVPVLMAKGLSEEQKQQFIIKDNVSFGEWDWDILGNEWEEKLLADCGLDVWQTSEDPDYSILEDEDLSTEMDSMTGGVKKAIQIEFEAEHFEEASELVKLWRSRGLYIGGFLMEKLKEEKLK